MAELSDFNNENTTSLSDLNTEQTKTQVNPTASNVNLAAYSAVLEPSGNVENTFRTVRAETENGLVSDTSKQITDFIHNREFSQGRQALINFLADPNVPIEQKDSAVKNFHDAQVEMSSIRNMTSNQALLQDSPGETAEAEKVRIDVGSAINEVNQYKRYVQAILNSEQAKSDSSMVDTVANFTELMAPFVSGANLAAVADEFKKGEGTVGTVAKSLALMGSSRAEIRDALASMPPEKRYEATQAIVDIVNKHKGIILTDDNDFARMENLRAFLDEGYYTTSDEWVDNAFSILDMTILGGPLAKIGGKLVKGLKLTGEAEEVATRATQRGVRSEVSPVSVSQNYKDVNPSKARATHELAAGDLTNEAAEAAYGSSRTEAVANDLLPEIGDNAEAVKNKVGSIDKEFVDSITPNADVMDFVNTDGAIYYWKEDKVRLRSQVVNDFKNAFGLHTRDEMFQVKNLTDGVQVRATYGPKEGGFSDAQNAVELAKFALRDYGITDDQLKLLKRQGEEYIPVDINTTGEGDFLIAVDHKYKFNPADLQEWEKADVKRNLFDYAPPMTDGRQGTLQRTILDAHSVLHPNITLGANVSVDKATGLEKALAELGKEFGEGFSKLKKSRRNLVEKFIKEANDQGIDFTYPNMKAAGLDDNEMSILKKWREAWDTHYHLENRDLARTLKARGYKAFEDKSTQTRLFAKPRGKQNFKGSVKVYDPQSDGIIIVDKNTIDKLYDDGGTLAELRDPIIRGDEVAEFVASPEKVGGPYLRALNDNDQVLAYRKGYYQVHYTDPKFIVKVIRDSRGNIISEKAVASAGSVKDAEVMKKRLALTEGVADDDTTFYVRGDVKKIRPDSNDYWNLQSSAGRTAQKTRGKRLEDATSLIANPSHENILDPVEALAKSIRSVSRRVVMRDYLEATKQRFINQYKDVLPKGKFGEPTFPSSRMEIGKPGQKVSGQAADARTAYEYINYLENGYINSIDDFYKAGMNALADMLGQVSAPLEKGVRAAGEANIPQTAKGMAFKLYLATNPLRQIIVQSHQMVRLFGLDPVYTGAKMGDEALILLAELRDLKVTDGMLKRAGMTRDEAKQMAKDIKRSGLLAAVDANNLVRGDLISLADMNFAGKARSFANKPVEFLQRIGFDAGEQANILTSWLVHRNLAKKAGRTLDAETMDEVAAQARNFTYNMNFAGDMPYNQNALNVAFQFLQVPHKAMLQYTNRAIPASIRARMAAFDAVMWGIPAGFATAWFGDYLPDNRDAREAITYGIEQLALNKLIGLMAGDDTRIDFSSLAPADMTGLWTSISEIWFGKGLGQIIAESPSGQLMFGNNPRMTNAFKTAARYMNLIDDYSDPTEFSDVAHSFAQLSSGYSNAFKAAYALKYGEKINSLGSITDYNVNTPEAIAALFGFETLDEANNRKVKQSLYDNSTALKDDVTQWHKDFKMHLNRKGITPKDYEYTVKMFSEAWRVWGNDNQRARDILKRLIEKDISNGEDVMFKSLMNSKDFMSLEDTKALIKESGLPEEKQKVLLDGMDFINSYREQ